MAEADGQTVKDSPYWWDTVETPTPEVVAPDKVPAQADVAVVGAGFTGLSASLTLASEGRDVVCVDQHVPGQGASTRNGGMIGSGHRVGFADAKRRYGEELGIALVHEGLEAYAFTRDLIARHGIDCDFAQTGRFRVAWTARDFEVMTRDVESLSKHVALEASVVTKSDQHREIDTALYHGGVIYHQHGGLNPRKFHDGLLDAAVSAGAAVHPSTSISGIERRNGGFRVETDRGAIDCGEVLIATNGYTPGFLRFLASRILPVPSYMIATEPLEKAVLDDLLPGRRMMVETRNRHCYYRRAPDDSRILLGARAALIDVPQQRATATLSKVLSEIFPRLSGVRITHSWRGYTGFTFAHLPHVGVHDDDGLHFALGYSGSGVAMAPYLGFKAAMRVLKRSDGETAFSRTHFKGRPYYRGRPWFMPLADALFNVKDRIDNVRAGR